MTLYVIGHKNPDTDSVCAAIGYADLLRRGRNPDATPAICGAINPRTEFVLKRAGLEHPMLLMDVRPSAIQIADRRPIMAYEEETFMAVYRRMEKYGLRTMPVVDEEERFLGLLSFLDLLHFIIPAPEEYIHSRSVASSIAQIATTLGATIQNAVEPNRREDLLLVVGAMSKEVFADQVRKYPAERLTVLCGNRPSIQSASVRYGARCLIVTGGYELSPEMLEEARQAGVAVLSSPHDTAMTALMIKTAKTIGPAVHRDVLTFHENASLSTMRSAAEARGQDLLPILDNGGHLVGTLEKARLFNPPRPKLVLVDHNEVSQAVTGVEEADIIEVVDHHRLGGSLVSRDPIRLLIEPVGSTSTLVAKRFREEELRPAAGIALCLAGGIIADTLNLQGPTTTDTDREMLTWLSTLCSEDLERYAHELLAAGSVMAEADAAKAVSQDMKEYAEHGWRIAVSQLEETDMDAFERRKPELAEALEAMRKERGLDFACLLVTDIVRQDSLLLTVGEERLEQALDYPRLEHDLFELKDIVSRKKQLLPHLIWVLGEVAKPTASAN